MKKWIFISLNLQRNESKPDEEMKSVDEGSALLWPQGVHQHHTVPSQKDTVAQKLKQENSLKKDLIDNKSKLRLRQIYFYQNFRVFWIFKKSNMEMSSSQKKTFRNKIDIALGLNILLCFSDKIWKNQEYLTIKYIFCFFIGTMQSSYGLAGAMVSSKRLLG